MTAWGEGKGQDPVGALARSGVKNVGWELLSACAAFFPSQISLKAKNKKPLKLAPVYWKGKSHGQEVQPALLSKRLDLRSRRPLGAKPFSPFPGAARSLSWKISINLLTKPTFSAYSSCLLHPTQLPVQPLHHVLQTSVITTNWQWSLWANSHRENSLRLIRHAFLTLERLLWFGGRSWGIDRCRINSLEEALDGADNEAC